MAMLVIVVRRLRNLAYHSMALYVRVLDSARRYCVGQRSEIFFALCSPDQLWEGGHWPTTNGQQGNQSVVECLVPN